MTDQAERTLWGIGTSRTVRPHWMFQELGLAYETKPISTRTPAIKTPEFQQFGSNGKIPVLQDGDFVLRESAAMVNYLGDRYGGVEKKLLPAPGTRDRAPYDQWCFYVAMELDASSLYVIRRHEDLASIYGGSPQVAKSCREYFSRQLRVVDRQLAETPYLLGVDFSGADILLTSCLDWAVFYGIDLPESVQSYHARVADREAYKKAFALNFPLEIMEALVAGRAPQPG